MVQQAPIMGSLGADFFKFYEILFNTPGVGGSGTKHLRFS